MQLRKRTEKIAVDCSRIRNSRIAKKKREHGAESRPEDENCYHDRGAPAVEVFHEIRNDEVRTNSFPPRYHPHQSEVQREIPYAADCERIQNRARHYVGRILHFVADVAHIVISEIVVHGDQSSTAETEHEATIKVHRPGRKIERHVSIEVEK